MHFLSIDPINLRLCIQGLFFGLDRTMPKTKSTPQSSEFDLLQLKVLEQVTAHSPAAKLALQSFKATIILGLPTEERHKQLNRLLLEHEKELIRLLAEAQSLIESH